MPTVSGLPDNGDKRLVRAKTTATEGKSIITAAAIVSGSQATAGGEFYQANVEAYLMVCANPWPPVKADGTWAPWRDEPGNCTVGGGACYNTNYELYYCRDAGGAGTADDLPAIQSDNAAIRPYSAEQDILKEFYFFRESLPDASGLNLATTTNNEIKQGGKVGLVWAPVIAPSGQVLDKYLVYYGTASTSLTQSLAVITNGTGANPQTISNLTNGVKYYFAVTAKYKSGAESGYSNQTTAVPADIWAPRTPADFTGTVATSSASLNWTANTDDTAAYKVYYGATSGALGASISLNKSQCALGKCSTKINNLNKDTKYYFAVAAVDGYKNESNRTAPEIDLIIK